MCEKIFPIKLIVQSSEEANRSPRLLVEKLLGEKKLEMAGTVLASMPKRRKVEIILGNKSITLPHFLWRR